MSDGLNKWEDVIKRVEDHDARIEKLEKNDAKQDRALTEMTLDLGTLADIVHRAKKRARALKKRTGKG